MGDENKRYPQQNCATHLALLEKEDSSMLLGIHEIQKESWGTGEGMSTPLGIPFYDGNQRQANAKSVEHLG